MISSGDVVVIFDVDQRLVIVKKVPDFYISKFEGWDLVVVLVKGLSIFLPRIRESKGIEIKKDFSSFEVHALGLVLWRIILLVELFEIIEFMVQIVEFVL